MSADSSSAAPIMKESYGKPGVGEQVPPVGSTGGQPLHPHEHVKEHTHSQPKHPAERK